MGVIHLICGPVAAGKSTYSIELARRTGAIIFSIDKWMQTLFGADIPIREGMAAVDFIWFAERINRCEDQIWDVSAQLLQRDVSVIFDWGFIRRERRDQAAEIAGELGYATQWHVLDVPLDIRQRRVADRNAQQGETFAFSVTPAMFAFAERMYEAPDRSELISAIWAEA